MRTYNVLVFTIPTAFQIVCALLIGNSVGEGNINLAFTYFKMSFASGISTAMAIVYALQINQARIIHMFTQIPEVVAEVKEVTPVFYCYVFVVFIQFICMGVINGTGKMATGALITSVGYWLVGLPISYILISCSFRAVSPLSPIPVIHL